MRIALTTLVWIISAANVTLGALIAAEFVFMATSLDPSQLATGGIETWSDALECLAAFAILVLATVVSLAMWHTRRFKVVGFFLTATETCGVAWACVQVYRDYL